jgi:hypothetical protein
VLYINTESLKKAQHGKIENVAGSVWLSLFMDGSWTVNTTKSFFWFLFRGNDLKNLWLLDYLFQFLSTRTPNITQLWWLIYAISFFRHEHEKTQTFDLSNLCVVAFPHSRGQLLTERTIKTWHIKCFVILHYICRVLVCLVANLHNSLLNKWKHNNVFSFFALMQFHVFAFAI